jgi:hypothetical protein
MKNSFSRKLFFMTCFVFVGYQIKADDYIDSAAHTNIEFRYKNLIDSGKLKANIYGLTSVLIDLTDSEDGKIYDEVIKYFISHGCDINEKFDYKKLFIEFFPKYINLIDEDFELSQNEKQEEADEIKEEAEKVFNSNILIKLFLYFHHGIMIFAASSDNPYLVKALIENGADVNNLGGLASFFKFGSDYELITEGYFCSSESYKDAILDVVKHIYKNNSYMNQAIMYVCMSKQMYKKINE